MANPVAHKTHICCECGGVIKLFETYERASGIWDGEPMRFKTCLDCVEMRKELSEGEEQWYYGGLWEAIVESGHAEFRRRMEKRRKPVAIHPDHAIVRYDN